MSHSVGPGTAGTSKAGTEHSDPGEASILDVVKVFARLLPKQLKDEAQLAKLELTDKAKTLGKGAAFVAVGLVFLLLATIALVGAAIAGLAQVMPSWLAALLLAVLFLVVLAVAALIGVSTIKKALPLVPRKAVFGTKYDLGVVKEGSAYTEARVQREEQLARERKEQEKREAAQDPARQKPPAPTEEQLRHRLKLRREHLKTLRDDVQGRAETIQATTKGFVDRTGRTVRSTPKDVRSALGAARGTRPAGTSGGQGAGLGERWQPLTVLAVAGSAFVVFLRKLFR
ncbi:phage holin family protein [Kocuria flava]|uniref:phage holin family protein n=1 Tax=Kocuria flava TaxID=446860 RepID=UPI000DD413C9|nr:phage holin family protein [Kocuria flava]MCJ8504780.1 phage holin family protein [Kocuria flava]